MTKITSREAIPVEQIAVELEPALTTWTRRRAEEAMMVFCYWCCCRWENDHVDEEAATDRRNTELNACCAKVRAYRGRAACRCQLRGNKRHPTDNRNHQHKTCYTTPLKLHSQKILICVEKGKELDSQSEYQEQRGRRRRQHPAEAGCVKKKMRRRNSFGDENFNLVYYYIVIIIIIIIIIIIRINISTSTVGSGRRKVTEKKMKNPT